MSDDDLTFDEKVALFMGGEIPAAGFEIRSQKVELTNQQAKLLVGALAQMQLDKDLDAEVARQTQTMLMDRYGIDDPGDF
jgi:hypothetical protein